MDVQPVYIAQTSDGEEGTQYSSCDQWKQTDCEIDKVGRVRTIPIIQPMQIAVKIQTLKNARHQKIEHATVDARKPSHRVHADCAANLVGNQFISPICGL